MASRGQGNPRHRARPADADPVTGSSIRWTPVAPPLIDPSPSGSPRVLERTDSILAAASVNYLGDGVFVAMMGEKHFG